MEGFEDAWQGGSPPRLEGLIDGWEGPARAELFRQALTIEVDYRRRLGEGPRTEEYGRRFPTLAGIVRAAFDEEATAAARPDAAGETVNSNSSKPPCWAPGPRPSPIGSGSTS